VRRENLFFCLAALAMVLEIFGLPGTRDSDLAHAAGGAALPPAAPVVAVYQPLDEQLEVFIVDATGALNVVWKDNDGAWKTPFPLTRAIFTIPSVSAIYYPTYQQLEVFVVDKNGILNVVWKDHNGAWHAPVGLTDPGFAPAGAPLAAVYQPPNEQLEVFVVGANGALNVVWKDNNGVWKRPPCSGGNCPGWQMLDNNPRTVAIVASGSDLYQLHNDGWIWQYTGAACGGDCPGWLRLDDNGDTKSITTGGDK